MKRIYTIAALLLSLGCVFAAHRTSAQTPSGGSQIGSALKQYDEAESRARSLVKSILGGDLEAPVADKAALREKLRPLVEDSFKARQQFQQAEVEELRRRLAEIERAIEEREKNKGVIVNSRIDELLASPPAANRNQPLDDYSTPSNKSALNANKSRRDDAYDETNNPPGVPNQAVPGSPEAALPKLPPGVEARVRYIQDKVVENGVEMPITRRVVEYVQIERPKGGEPEAIPLESYAPAPRKTDANVIDETKDLDSSESGLDFGTRERLAQLDLQAAEEEHAAAEHALSSVRQLHNSGVTPVSEVLSHEKELRHAAIELRRAKVKLEGLAVQRAELQTAAESALVETSAEVERATAKVQFAEAQVAAAEAKKAQLDADVEGTKSSHAFQVKRFERLKHLARVEKAIDLKLVDEAEEKLHAGEAALSSAQAAAAHGSADIDQAKAALTEARAELDIAAARRRAAQARLDRLMRQPPQSDADPLKPSAGPSELDKPQK
ncbi:MAG TPA: hypothetical protein VHB99_19995 [Pirellulales bacterium]|nr:hypothetical protein [Pirellulales bacterium]